MIASNAATEANAVFLGDEMDDSIKEVIEKMDAVIEDTSVPRNIRKIVEEAKSKVEGSEDLNVGISGAIYALDDISNDINMPFHTRTEIWGIISDLETIREQNK